MKQQPVQGWDAYLGKLADTVQMEGCLLPPDAYRQQPLQPAVCLNVAVAEEGVARA